MTTSPTQGEHAQPDALRQILLDPENQPNQYGVQFLMHGPKMAFKIGARQFTLDYEPTEPGEFEFMRDALIDAFSIFTPDVKTAQPAAPQGGAYAELPDVDALAQEIRRVDGAHKLGAGALAEALMPFLRASHGQAPAGTGHEKEMEEALRERDDADDFIDALLDEVLGTERAEWSSAYGRADALEEVRERITALHKPAVDRAWTRFEEATAQPAPAATPQADSQLAPVRQGKWTWVPVEPSTAMLVAGNHGQPGNFSALKVWQDMLGALERSFDYTRPVDPPSTTQAAQEDSVHAPVLLSDEELCQLEEPYLLNFRIPLGGQYDFARAVEKAVLAKTYGTQAPNPTPPAQAADSVLEDAARLAKIMQAIRDYHFALDNREHGGIAMARAWNAICDVLNMDWVQGAESAARKQGANHD